MLKVNGVKKTFRNNSGEVLRGIDFEIEKGDVVAIIGPSGSGKTTLLRCMSFLEKADAGMITFKNKSYDMKTIKKKEIHELRMSMGFVFQDFNLFSNKTALMNITEGLITARKIPKDEAIEIARKMLKKVGLEDKESFYPDELSGGQKQRVAIARAVALNPDVIFFDEPTSALDPELTREVTDVMKKLAKDGTTMIVVTHEMEFAREAANRIVFMENGEIIEDSPATEFFKSPSSPRSAEFISKYVNN